MDVPTRTHAENVLLVNPIPAPGFHAVHALAALTEAVFAIPDITTMAAIALQVQRCAAAMAFQHLALQDIPATRPVPGMEVINGAPETKHLLKKKLQQWLELLFYLAK